MAIARSGRLGNKLEAVSSVGKSASRSPNKDKPFGPFEASAPPAGFDKPPVANVREHIRAVNATHLANIALLTNRTVKIDPQTQTFANDPEANQLTKRARRPGFEITV